MAYKGLLIVISGPSGCGKGTICRALRQKHPEIKVSVSATTRERRVGEIEGQDYFYISQQEFSSQIDDGGFLEYARIYSGHYYGTPKKYVRNTLKKGNDLILEIDIQGALQVKEKFEEGIFIFLVPPTMDELHRRLVERGRETPELIMERFKSAYEEMDFINRYNYVVTNDKIDEAVLKIEAIISAEKCRVSRNEALLSELLDGGNKL